jgi:hypothetical protein
MPYYEILFKMKQFPVDPITKWVVIEEMHVNPASP